MAERFRTNEREFEKFQQDHIIFCGLIRARDIKRWTGEVAKWNVNPHLTTHVYSAKIKSQLYYIQKRQVQILTLYMQRNLHRSGD